MPLGLPVESGDDFERPLRWDVVHAVKIQLAMVGLAAESGVGEIDVIVAAHHDVVRRVQALAFPAVGQHLDGALLVRAGHATGPGFAGVQAALAIERVAGRPLHVFPIDLGSLRREPT